MPANPSSFSSVLNLTGGWLRSANINGIITYCDAASIGHVNNYQYSRYALTWPSGERQKSLHARGTKEVNWSVSGDLSTASANILNFLNPYYRGLIFPVGILQSGYESGSDYVAQAMMESFQVSGAADGTVKFSISGKSLSDVTSGPVWSVVAHKFPVPAWSSGNDLVRAWTLTHTTQLAANWHNNQNPLPDYYRPSESEFTLQIQTMQSFEQYDTISLGVGSFAFINGLVTSRTINHSGREPKVYECQVTNVDISNDPRTPGGTVGVSSSAPSDWI